MDLRGQQVLHQEYGEGSITEHTGNLLTIAFKQGEKRFVFPEAFNNFLEIKDNKIAILIKNEIDKNQAQKALIKIEEKKAHEERDHQRALDLVEARKRKPKAKV